VGVNISGISDQSKLGNFDEAAHKCRKNNTGIILFIEIVGIQSPFDFA
jgi:hypothetical protein